MLLFILCVYTFKRKNKTTASILYITYSLSQLCAVLLRIVHIRTLICTIIPAEGGGLFKYIYIVVIDDRNGKK